MLDPDFPRNVCLLLIGNPLFFHAFIDHAGIHQADAGVGKGSGNPCQGIVVEDDVRIGQNEDFTAGFGNQPVYHIGLSLPDGKVEKPQ